MYKIKWKITFEKHAPVEGYADVAGEVWHLAPLLPEDRIVSAEP